MGFLGGLFIVSAFAVAFELATHIVYHAKTGKAGLYDKPFEYLADAFKCKRF